MAFYEEITENWTMPGVTYTAEEQVDNYYDAAMAPAPDFNDFRFYNEIDTDILGFGMGYILDYPLPATTSVGPYSWVVLPYNNFVNAGTENDPFYWTPWWDYDVYVDPWTSFAQIPTS
jgi:hypothetical protein